jgi:hypothetical protein
MKEKREMTTEEVKAHNQIAAMISMTKILNDQLSDDAKRTFALRVKADPDILGFLLSREVMPLKVAERFIVIIRDLINSVETPNMKGMN